MKHKKEHKGKGRKMHGEPPGPVVSTSAYNQTSNKNEHEPDQHHPYFSRAEVEKMHGSEDHGDMTGSVNSRSGEGIMGHGVEGEPAIGKGK